MPDETPKTSTDLDQERRPRKRARWWVTAAAAVVAAVAAAFVVVPRTTGDVPEALAAENSWRGACLDQLTNGSITRAIDGWRLTCDGMEAYFGKSDGAPGGAIGPRDSAACVRLNMRSIYISDADLADVVDVYWDPYRGWFGQGGKDKAAPGGYANGLSREAAAGVLQGKRADGSVKWEHQYGTDVISTVGPQGICRAKNP